jgi:formylglycine-generating enzyme required for sulfatase activity/5-hydroxyisourate hydrolase-like protein (transthyretin family)
MRKSLLLILLSVFFSINLSAQISVQSFKVLGNDLTARLQNPVIDQNGEKCALIRVVTTESGFEFEAGVLGIMKTVKKTGEYWVYIPHGSKRISILHNDLGVLRNYVYTEAILEATVYEMVLTTDKVTTIVEKREIRSQWLVITTEPEGADVYIDEKHCGQTDFLQEFKEGPHTYRVSKDLYHSEAGQLELIVEDGKKKMDFKLRPNFGFVNIKSLPESGAGIFLDNVDLNVQTPHKTDRVKSGAHKVKITHQWYEDAEKEVVVQDGETSELIFDLEPKFAALNINTSPDAEIYLDGKLEGNTSLAKRLMAGTYELGIKKAMYFDIAETIEIKAGEPFTKKYELLPAFADVNIQTSPDAEIYLDGKLEGSTSLAKRLMAGTYELHLKKAKYYEIAETIEIKAGEPFTKKYELLPAFGGLSIATSPESGAEVSVDGKPTGKVTPCTLEQLASGEHLVTLRREWYEPQKFMIRVEDGKSQNLTKTLVPTFVEISINTLPEADIFIDNVKVGTGTHKGRIKTGIHTFEARKDKHHAHQKKEEIVLGGEYNFQLSPSPQYGILKVLSDPFDATILLNGKESGTTPKTFYDLLVGEYAISLFKAGYGTIIKNISILENETIAVNEILPSGTEVTIASSPSVTSLSIDGNYVGTTPYTATLAFGQHQLQLINGKSIMNETINLSQNGQSTFQYDVIEFGAFTENVNGMSFDMVAVKGGTFQMGSRKEKNEKPVHSVTVSDFYIGKYEVTQKQWKAIMGASTSLSNPSKFKGNNLPVESVSWNDVQKFIKKLNQKTGKLYRLPTEAEWEYAVRGDSTGSTTKYASSNNVDVVAWYSGNSGSKTHTVGTKQANELGIYDMNGNVWEWCSDWFGSYRSRGQSNPLGATSGSYRVYRGGSWYNLASNCRGETRYRSSPGYRHDILGFRLASSY